MYALTKLAPYMSFSKKEFFLMHFSNPILLSFSSGMVGVIRRFKKKKLNALYEKRVRIRYNDKRSTFQELLDKDKFFSIRTPYLQTLTVVMFKVAKGFAPDISEM